MSGSDHDGHAHTEGSTLIGSLMPSAPLKVRRLPTTASTKLSSRSRVWYFTLPIVQPEGELVNVLGKMLFADLVIDAVHAALQNRPDAFNAVRGSGTLRIYSRHVVDRLVPVEQPIQSQITRSLVCEESRTNFHVVMDGLLQTGRAGIDQRHCDVLPPR